MLWTHDRRKETLYDALLGGQDTSVPPLLIIPTGGWSVIVIVCQYEYIVNTKYWYV